MPKLPQLTPFDAEEQQLYSKLPLDGRAPHPIFKAEPSHPLQETHFSCLHLLPHSFVYNPDLVTIGEGLNLGE